MLAAAAHHLGAPRVPLYGHAAHGAPLDGRALASLRAAAAWVRAAVTRGAELQRAAGARGGGGGGADVAHRAAVGGGAPRPAAVQANLHSTAQYSTVQYSVECITG